MDKLGPYLLGPNCENQGIYVGDAKELAPAIPDESVDLIFTDPIYGDLEIYKWLAGTALRILKPRGICLVWSNGKWHYTHTKRLESAGLSWRWTFTHINNDTNAPLMGKVIAKANRVIWMDVDRRSKLLNYIPDGYVTYGSWTSIPRVEDPWYKSVPYTAMLLYGFTQPGDVLVDFFTGTGTTPAVAKQWGLRSLAFEIQPHKAKDARRRVCQTQPPLLVPEPQQMGLKAL